MANEFNYELMLILPPDRSKKDQDATLKEIKDQIKSLKGSLQYEETWGEREFAYKIKGFNEGYYVIYNYNFNQDKIKELQDFLDLEKDVIRYMNVKTDKHFDKFDYEKMQKEDSEYFKDLKKRIAEKAGPDLQKSKRKTDAKPKAEKKKEETPAVEEKKEEPKEEPKTEAPAPVETQDVATPEETKPEEPKEEAPKEEKPKEEKPKEKPAESVDSDFEKKLQDIIDGDI